MIHCDVGEQGRCLGRTVSDRRTSGLRQRGTVLLLHGVNWSGLGWVRLVLYERTGGAEDDSYLCGMEDAVLAVISASWSLVLGGL